MDDRLDIIIFGATGYTGKFCIQALHRLANSKTRSFTWGVAGRSESKLKDVIEECESKIGASLASVEVVVADLNDYNSLTKMTSRAKVIINCSGPYRFFGEPVIKACIETGTHQVDVTGEPEYMESIQLKYHQAAQEKGIYIVSACGFDSIPADLGVVYLQKCFEGTLNSVETYLQLKQKAPAIAGPSGNYATWESAVHGLANAAELGSIRRKLYPTRLPSFTPKLKPQPSVHKSDVVNSWCVPFIGSDRSVILRSQRYFYEQKKVRPVQVHTYVQIESIFQLAMLLIIGAIFQFLVKFGFGRSLLLKYPEFFSAGMFSSKPPPIDKVENMKLDMLLRGVGWSEKLSQVDDQYKTPPNKVVKGRVSGMNPGYGITTAAVALSAMTILTEQSKLPEKGGVYPPGAAFAETSLLDRLQENGLKFEIISVSNL